MGIACLENMASDLEVGRFFLPVGEVGRGSGEGGGIKLKNFIKLRFDRNPAEMLYLCTEF